MNTKDKNTFKRGRKSPRNTVKPVEKNLQVPKTPGNEEIVDESGSLYSKMFADRGPNKRKVKMRAIAEDLFDEADPGDSDYKFVNEDSSGQEDINTDTDDTVVSDKHFSTAVNEPAEISDADFADIDNEPTPEENNEEKVREFLKKWKLDDPGVCCICLENSTTEDNMLVYCDGDDCEVVCHQECYGIVHLPATDEPWYCDKCLAKPGETVTCALCPKQSGAFRRMKEGDKAGTWVHLVCALWMPGMWIGKTAEMSEITIEIIDQKNWNKPCCVCGPGDAQEGATVHCDAGECKSWLHVTCAQSLNLLECVEEDPEISDPYFVYCPQHGSHGPPRLNEWERWYRKRDRFLDQVRKEESSARLKRIKSYSDSGTGLLEIFEDKYARYRVRREQRIARCRRKIAQMNSQIQGLGEQKDKYENQTKDYANKITNLKKENVAIEKYLEQVNESLLILSKSMINLPNTPALNAARNNSKNCPSIIDNPAVDSILKCLETTPEVQWTDQSKDIAQKIQINKLDTSCVTSLGIKSIQQIVAQREKEQKLKKTKKGKRRSTNSRTSTSGSSKKKYKEPADTQADNTANSSAQDAPSPSTKKKQRGRPAKSKTNDSKTNRSSNNDSENTDSVNSNAASFDSMQTVQDNNLIDIIDVVGDRQTNNDISLKSENFSNNIFTGSSSNVYTNGVDVGKFPFNVNKITSIATLLNPVESIMSSENSNNLNIVDNNNQNIIFGTNNLANRLAKCADGFTTNNASVNVNTINDLFNSNRIGNIGGSSINSSFINSTPAMFANGQLSSNSLSRNGGNLVNSIATSFANGVIAGPSTGGSGIGSYSQMKGILNPLHVTSVPGGFTTSPTNDTVAKISYLTSSIVPQSTVPLFTATPTPAGFFTTTPVTHEASPSKRRKVDEENHEAPVDHKRRQTSKGKKSSKKIPEQLEEVVAEDEPERPQIPQPICAVCNLVPPPSSDQPSATYITPTKARSSMLLKGRDKVHRMIRCNFCTKWYHLGCMNPARRTMPTGGYVWRCEDCDPGSDASDGSFVPENERPTSPRVPAETSEDQGDGSSQSTEKDKSKKDVVVTRKWNLRSASKH
ncbi:PHD finger protein 14 [Gigaspora margarita]|uniref:PHD finger protein 14 n=1 Tax=Gigaspora margarita TaxID=4874 RepID=A0A8H4A3F7_GIGMA|nr:PHD finger protein 14 [Gigaspora margarita]